jgi:hypothetical protein
LAYASFELHPWSSTAALPAGDGRAEPLSDLETGRRDEGNCKKERFEASLRDAVPRRYLAELADTPWDGADA